MKKNEITGTSINNSSINDSYIGCVINQELTIKDESIKESFNIILDEIKGVDDIKVKSKLLSAYNVITSFYNINRSEFIQLACLSSCSFGNQPSSAQFLNIIKFWIIINYDKKIDMGKVTKSSGEFKKNNHKLWFFSPSSSGTTSFEKGIANIEYFLDVMNLNTIKNGRCYISKLKPKGINCTYCKDGHIDLNNISGIVDDFIDCTIIDKKDEKLQKDFMNINNNKNLYIQCGSCISDIEEVPQNIKKFI